MYLAKEAGASAAKFQLFRADSLARQRNAQDYWHIYKAFELPDWWLGILLDDARDLGIDFMCTAYDAWGLETVTPFVARYKVASFEAAAYGLLAAVRLAAEKHHKGVVLSTGMTTQDEVRRAVDVLGVSNLDYLLHCVSAYPCPPDALNLRAMQTLMAAFPGIPVGLSDHTLSIAAPVAAVALGAQCIEKHMTDDRQRVGPDHAFAIQPAEFRLMVNLIHDVEMGMGDGVKAPQAPEQDMMRYRVVSQQGVAQPAHSFVHPSGTLEKKRDNQD